MISLRSLTRFASVAVAALALAACNDGPANPLSRDLSLSGANFKKSGNTGNAAKNGDIDVRVLLDKSGNAVLQVRTGTYDPTTNTATPDGYFQQIQYKVYDSRGKQVLVRTVHFESAGVQTYTRWINPCLGNGSEDYDDDHGHGGDGCASKLALNYTVSVQANLKGVDGDDKKTDVVREDGINGYLPDIDLSHSLVALAGVPNAPAGSVPANVASLFSVDVANLIVPGGDNTGAPAQVSCLVTVDGFPQLPLPNGQRSILNPNAYGFAGDPVFTVVPNGHTPCQFTLTLPEGTHKIVVTGVVLSPGDYDLSNNSTVKFTVTAASRPTEISAGPLQVDLGAGPVNLDPPSPSGAPTINPNKQINLDQVVALNDGAPPGQVTCTATITPLPSGTPVTLVATANLTSAPGVSCIMPYAFPAPGDYSYSVDVTPTDGAPENNHKGPVTIHVSNPPQYAVATVGPITVLSGTSHTALTDTVVHSGDVMQYTANITAVLTGTTSTTVTCNAIVDGAQVPANAWIGGQSGTVTTTSPTKTCTFSMTLNDASVAANGAPHNVSIGVTTPADVPNLAPIGPGVNTATNKGQVFVATRLDLRAGPFVLVGTPNQLLSNATVTQVTSLSDTKTITVQDTVYGPALASVNCGAIGMAPGTVGAAAILGILNPVRITPTVSIPSSGKAVCQYTLSTPAQLGIGAFPLIALVSNNGDALDPTPANNAATGTLDIDGNGTFTTVPTAHEITAAQGWLNSGSWSNDDQIETLNTQLLSIKHLALVLVPTSDVLGHFTMDVKVTSGPNDATVFGTQTVSGDLFRSTGAENCNAAQVGPNAPIANPNEPLNTVGNAALGYAASVCANQSAGDFQEVSVNYSQNLIGTVAGNGTPAPLLFTDHVTLLLTLRFTLTSSTHEQVITAKTIIPIDSFRGGDCLPLTGDENAPRACSTAFGNGAVTTP